MVMQFFLIQVLVERVYMYQFMSILGGFSSNCLLCDLVGVVVGDWVFNGV